MHFWGAQSNFWLGIILMCIGLTSCMVGPDFKSPDPPQTSTYTEKPQPKKTVGVPADKVAGKTQYFAAGHDVPGQWWFLFR